MGHEPDGNHCNHVGSKLSQSKHGMPYQVNILVLIYLTECGMYPIGVSVLDTRKTAIVVLKAHQRLLTWRI
jgi:hypothetical protein